MEKPPAGATELKVRVPVEGLPPNMLVGLSVKLSRVGGLTVRVAEIKEPFNVAVSLGITVAGTAVV